MLTLRHNLFRWILTCKTHSEALTPLLRVIEFSHSKWRHRLCNKRAGCAAAFKLHSDWCFIVANEIKYLTVFVFYPQAAVTPFFEWKNNATHVKHTAKKELKKICGVRALLMARQFLQPRASNYYTRRERALSKHAKAFSCDAARPIFLRVRPSLFLSPPTCDIWAGRKLS